LDEDKFEFSSAHAIGMNIAKNSITIQVFITIPDIFMQQPPSLLNGFTRGMDQKLHARRS